MRLFTSVALALIACASPALAQGTQTKPAGGELRWNLKAGDTMRYAFTWILDEKAELPGMGEMPGQTLEVAYSLDQKVKSVDDKGAVIEATIAAVRGRLLLGMMGVDMNYDSATNSADEENPMGWLRHLVGKTFTYTMTSRGEVTNVTGGDAIRTEIIEVVKKEAASKPKAGGEGGGGMGGMGMDPAAMMGQMAEQLTVVFSDTSLKSSLEVTNDILPTTAVKTDETWTRPIVEELPELGTLSYTAQYTHRGGNADATRITSRAEGEVTLEKAKKAPGAANDPMGAMRERVANSMEVKRKSSTGTHSFSGSKGRLLDSELVQEIVMEGPLPPEAAMMLGEQAKDAKMKRIVQLTLRYLAEEAPAAGGKPADKPKDEKGRSY